MAKKTNKANRSKNSKLDILIGKTFDWDEQWDWDDDTIPEDLLDKNGDPPRSLCGLWLITEICSDGKAVWVSFVPTDGDHRMEFPIDMLPVTVWDS